MKIFLAFLVFSIVAKASMEESSREGEEVGKKENKKAEASAKSDHSTEDLKPDKEKGKEFDADKAERNAQGKNAPPNEAGDFVRSHEVQSNRQKISEDDNIFKSSEEIINDSRKILEAESIEGGGDIAYIEESCIEGGDPYTLVYTRALHLKVNYEAEQRQTNWRCRNGHYNCPNLPNNIKHEQIIRPEKWELISEEWVSQNAEIFEKSETPDCELVSQRCLERGKRSIYGRIVERDCWVEQLEFQCAAPQSKGCQHLLVKGCEEKGKECIEKAAGGHCKLWRKHYRCPMGGRGKFCSLGKARRGIYCLEGDCFDRTYELDDGFMEAVAQLSVADEMKKDLEGSGLEGDKITVFTGKDLKCAKNITGSLLYDCCGKLKGLATKLKLTSCNAEEKLLAEQRSKNQCQYVGNYKRKVIGLWTSSKMHVYCCFPTKLSRIVQQEGRKQIGKGWGEPKKPNCSGFTLAELERLDFSKFDLSEFFEDIIKKLKVPNQKMK